MHAHTYTQTSGKFHSGTENLEKASCFYLKVVVQPVVSHFEHVDKQRAEDMPPLCGHAETNDTYWLC